MTNGRPGTRAALHPDSRTEDQCRMAECTTPSLRQVSVEPLSVSERGEILPLSSCRFPAASEEVTDGGMQVRLIGSQPSAEIQATDPLSLISTSVTSPRESAFRVLVPFRRL